LEKNIPAETSESSRVAESSTTGKFGHHLEVSNVQAEKLVMFLSVSYEADRSPPANKIGSKIHLPCVNEQRRLELSCPERYVTPGSASGSEPRSRDTRVYTLRRMNSWYHGQYGPKAKPTIQNETIPNLTPDLRTCGPHKEGRGILHPTNPY
jgi:hypothetical protein